MHHNRISSGYLASVLFRRYTVQHNLVMIIMHNPHAHYKSPPSCSVATRPNENRSDTLDSTWHRQILAKAAKTDLPIILQFPEKAAEAAKAFKEFRGVVMYAVKANACLHLLNTLSTNEIDCFDVASIQEVRLLRQKLPEATLCFMNPVKNANAIREAYSQQGVSTFALDSLSELHKILAATGQDNQDEKTKTLTLCVRIHVTSRNAVLALSGKFGVEGPKAVKLLQSTRQAARRLGVCFHVGSQAMDPADFRYAIEKTHDLIQQAKVEVDILDVGGGFPAAYPGLDPPALSRYFQVIYDAVDERPLFRRTELWAEPGRALSAQYNSLLVHVEKVEGGVLWINDGPYGNLSDAKYLKWPFKAVLFRVNQSEKPLRAYSVYGPTGDTADMIGGIMLPEDVALGDFILFEAIGAYGTVLSTRFCRPESCYGFAGGAVDSFVEVRDKGLHEGNEILHFAPQTRHRTCNRGVHEPDS